MANYEIDKERKVIKAIIPALSQKELATIKNYQAFGYTVLDVTRKDIQKPVNEKYKASVIQEFLEKKGTKEQQEKYWELYNAPYVDKKTGLNAVKKDGTLKKRGHVATLAWFKKEFPDYLKEEKKK